MKAAARLSTRRGRSPPEHAVLRMFILAGRQTTVESPRLAGNPQVPVRDGVGKTIAGPARDLAPAIEGSF
jgi:hypothetical protein